MQILMALCTDWSFDLREEKIYWGKKNQTNKPPADFWDKNYSHSFLSVGREAGGMQGSNNEERVPFKWVTAQSPLKNDSENIKGKTHT